MTAGTSEIYAFVDNSFLFIEGYKHVRRVANLPANKKPQVNYRRLRGFIGEAGHVRRVVLCGSNLAGNIISAAQAARIEAFTLPRYPDFKTGKRKEAGVDHKLCWEVAKSIFRNRDPTTNKKVIICTGDKDFMSILPDIQTSGWALELWLWSGSFSPALAAAVQTFGELRSLDQDWKKFIDIVDARARGIP